MSQRKGFALIAALWFVVLLSGLALEFSLAAHDVRASSINAREEAMARAAAEAGVDHARALLSDALRIAALRDRGAATLLTNSFGDPWRDLEALLRDTVDLGDQRYVVDLRDVGATLNVNSATEEELRRLFVALRIEPFMWRKPPTDRAYYPLYAKAAELGVALQTQVGHTGPLYPSETGRPLYIDEVALDFPDLHIVCGHIGWPWTEEMIAVAWKHRNVWIDTSAHVPKHYPPEFVHFMKTFGKDKVCFATDYPLLQWERVLAEVDGLDLGADVKQRFLRDNAVRAFNLKV